MNLEIQEYCLYSDHFLSRIQKKAPSHNTSKFEKKTGLVVHKIYMGWYYK